MDVRNHRRITSDNFFAQIRIGELEYQHRVGAHGNRSFHFQRFCGVFDVPLFCTVLGRHWFAFRLLADGDIGEFV